MPKLSRVAVLGTSTEPGNAEMLKTTELASAAFGVRLQYVEVGAPGEIETAFRCATKARSDAALALTSPITFAHRSQFVEDGGIMTYSVSFNDLFRRAVYYVDKILKGTKPAALPVEQPTKFELIINLKAASRSSSRFRQPCWHERTR